jgi:glucose/arabinose dehydrogenase
VRTSLIEFRLPGRILRAAAALIVSLAILAGVLASFNTTTASTAEAGTLPAGFQESVVFSGMISPTNVRFASDGRVFVAERSGVIKVYDSLTDKTPTVFTDLRTQVMSFWDRGLIGMALDPAFPARPYVYVAYTHDAAVGGTAPRWGKAGATSDNCPVPPGATALGCVVSTRLSRLTADGDKMVGEEKVLIEDWCQQFPSHSAGDIVFGADGALYMSGGDGASFNYIDTGQTGNVCNDPAGEGGALRAQDQASGTDPVTLHGSVIRVDPDTGYSLPDNPQAKATDANARRTVATGLRNPMRMTVRPGTNEVWVGDVGWKDWEEINRIVDPSQKMTNFGWPCREGPKGDNGYGDTALCKKLTGWTNPYYPYFHRSPVIAGDKCNNTGSSSTTGLAFYNGGNYPAQYKGALFFADYSRRCIYAMPTGAGGLPDPNKRLVFVAGAASPVDLEIGPNGDLFYVDMLGGTIRRVRYFNGNQPPVAVAAAKPANGRAPLTTTLDAGASYDPEKGVLTYAWDLDADGAFDDATGRTVSHTFPEGSWPVTLQVKDPKGSIATDTIIVTAGNTPPLPVIDTPKAGSTWGVGDTINVSGHAADAEQGTLPGTSLSWSLTIQHCASGNIESCHAHPVEDWDGTSSISFEAPDHDYPSHLELKLTATDAQGATASTIRELYPRTAKVGVKANWAGLTLNVDGSPAPAGGPTVILGSTHTITAPEVQTVGGVRYEFAGWSDGGTRSHDIVADGKPAPTATYRVTTRLTSAVSAGNVAKGQAVTVSGRLTRGTVPIAGLNVAVYRRASWSADEWVQVGTVKTDANGVAQLVQHPVINTEFQLRFAGSGGHLAATSPIVRMSVR